MAERIIKLLKCYNVKGVALKAWPRLAKVYSLGSCARCGRAVYLHAVLILPSSTETLVEPYPQWHYQYGLDAILLEIYEAVNGSIGTAA